MVEGTLPVWNKASKGLFALRLVRDQSVFSEDATKSQLGPQEAATDGDVPVPGLILSYPW